MIHWQVKFRSLRADTLYTVNIYDDRYQGDPIQLTPGESPFETEEENDRDWFKPVRTQSGYLTIVDDGFDMAGNAFDWLDLVPADMHDRYVTLTDGNGTVVWQGYIQPQTFSGKMYEPTQERRFPVMCCLSSLQGKQLPATNQGTITFARILDEIITWMGGSWDYVNIQSTDAIEWLQKKIDWSNFLDEEEDGTYTSKYDALTLLEEVCKFWGWTCRTSGKDIWLVCPDEDFEDDYIGIDPADLYDYIDAGITPQYQTGSWATRDLTGEVYANVDNNIEFVQGIRKATVKADINKRDIITDLPTEKIIDMYKDSTVQTVVIDTDKYEFYLHRDTGPEEYTLDDMHIDIDQYSTPSYNGYAYTQISDSYEGDLSDKHNYQWKYGLFIVGNLVGTPHESDYIVLFESICPHGYDHGSLVISGTHNGNATGTLKCRLRVGSKWWDGSTWVSTKTIFDMPIVENKIADNRVLNGPYNMYEGYGAPIGSPMGGKVRFEIVGYDTTLESDVIIIDSLKISFVRMLSYSDYDDERSENVYTGTSSKLFADEVNVDTIFASDQMNAFGLGIIMDYDGSYCDKVDYTYSGGLEHSHPEQHLLNRIINRGRYTRRIGKVNVLSNLAAITPYTKCVLPGFTGYPIAINRYWVDDVTEAYIAQL